MGPYKFSSKLWTKTYKGFKCDLIQETQIFLSPYFMLGIILETKGNTEVKKKKEDENSCIKKLHSNEDIKDFAFICFSLCLETKDFVLCDFPCSSTSEHRRIFWTKGSNEFSLAELPREWRRRLYQAEGLSNLLHRASTTQQWARKSNSKSLAPPPGGPETIRIHFWLLISSFLIVS